MYQLEFLSTAKQDLIDIARYIASELHNPQAAYRVTKKIISEAQSLNLLPYRYRVYAPLKRLSHEYRMVLEENYLIFYWVDEEPTKKVVIARIIYGRRCIQKRYFKDFE